MDKQHDYKDRILIVDDVIGNVQLLGKSLREGGYQITMAQNGIQALESVKAIPPDLILLDIMMPEMDGYETCKRLKADSKTKDIPVIFLTAKGEVEDVVEGFRLGAADYLTKPFNVEELLARAKAHLELRRARKTIEKQNDELKEAAKLRDDVDRIMRHDLKTPINSIISFPLILLRNDNLTDKQKTYITLIKEAGYRMLNMVSLSLDLIKMERGEYTLKANRLDIVEVIKKIATESDKQLNQKKLILNLNGTNDNENLSNPVYVKGEELLCYSLLANLIKNAIEASPEGEKISINIQENELVTISIHNTGVVPEKIRDRFFDKYVTTGKTSGTGLGTYSAKLLTETQKGRIRMVTSEGNGTTITVCLPSK